MNQEQIKHFCSIGRAMMDMAMEEKDDAMANQLARVGDKLANIETLFGPKRNDFTSGEVELIKYAMNRMKQNG